MTTHQDTAVEDGLLNFEYDIEEDVAEELEEYVRLCHIGQFDAADDQFRLCLRHHRDWYPISAEHADRLFRQGRYKELGAWAVESLTSCKCSLQEAAVFKILVVLAKCYETNDASSLIDEAIVIWDEVSPHLTIVSASDTEIHLWELFLYTAVLTSSLSARLIDRMNADICPNGQWTFFVDWFGNLLEKCALWEAQCMLQSLVYVLSEEENSRLILLYLKSAEVAGFTAEPVQAAVSSLLQRVLYVGQIGRDPGRLRAIPWNGSITQGLFGTALETSNEILPLTLKELCLQQTLYKLFEGQVLNPIAKINRADDLRDPVITAAKSQRLSEYGDSFRRRHPDQNWSDVVGMAFQQALVKKETPVVLEQLLRHTSLHSQDALQRTALHMASIKGYSQGIKFLLDKGADPLSVDWFGYTPLHYIAELDDEEEACELAGAIFFERNTNLASVNALLPLHRIVQYGNLPFVYLLLLIGAEVDTVDQIGRTPIQLAVEKRFHDLIGILAERDRHKNVTDPVQVAAFLELWCRQRGLAQGSILQITQNNMRNLSSSKPPAPND